eukprot:gene23500-biopygen17821
MHKKSMDSHGIHRGITGLGGIQQRAAAFLLCRTWASPLDKSGGDPMFSSWVTDSPGHRNDFALPGLGKSSGRIRGRSRVLARLRVLWH